MSAPLMPPNHPDRLSLAGEAHARPSAQLSVPSRISYLAVLTGSDERNAEWAHLVRLCQVCGVAPPGEQHTHFSTALATAAGPLHLKWERHGEFSSWTLFAPGLPESQPGRPDSADDPFAQPAAARLPPDWLQNLPGQVLVAAHVLLAPAPDELPTEANLCRYFGEQLVVGAEVADGAALVYTSFQVQDDGFSRFVLLSRRLGARRAGRVVQRLCEIEAYRMMALLALPLARQLSPRTVAIEKSLAVLTDGIAQDIARSEAHKTGLANGGARDQAADESLLHELTRLAAEVERSLSASQFRFGACRAYAELVRTRIHELREQRLSGLQTLGGFMARRFEPAVATCATVSSRLHDLSERVSQASNLLSTRVDIARERQNQALLSSMDRRAKLQLRLQQTVEGLSVAAIVYYVVGLVGYVAKGAKAGGLSINTDLAVGVAVPVAAAVMVWALRRARKHIHAGDDPPH